MADKSKYLFFSGGEASFQSWLTGLELGGYELHSWHAETTPEYLTTYSAVAVRAN